MGITMASSLTPTIFTIPLLYALQSTKSAIVAFLLIAAAWLIIAGYTSINAVVKAELFPTRVRATGVGVPYAVTVSIFGGTAESLALWFKSIGHETWFYYYLTGVIAQWPEVKRAYPITPAVPVSMYHRALALWLSVEASGGHCAVCIVVEFWQYASRGVMVEWSAIPEAHRPGEVPPYQLLDDLDNEPMPTNWSADLARQVRTWRDGMANLSKVAI
jgi:hypothetical protein